MILELTIQLSELLQTSIGQPSGMRKTLAQVHVVKLRNTPFDVDGIDETMVARVAGHRASILPAAKTISTSPA
jgi:hypothetical protein